MILKNSLLATTVASLVLAGCASDQQLLANEQDNAVRTALRLSLIHI